MGEIGAKQLENCQSNCSVMEGWGGPVVCVFRDNMEQGGSTRGSWLHARLITATQTHTHTHVHWARMCAEATESERGIERESAKSERVRVETDAWSSFRAETFANEF